MEIIYLKSEKTFLLVIVFFIFLVIPLQSGPQADNELDFSFLRTAYLNNQWKLEVGKVVVKQTETTGVKNFAQCLVARCSDQSHDLATLMKKKGINGYKEFDALRRETLIYLSKQRGAGIDREYMSMAVDDLASDLTLYQKVSGQTKDPEIKTWIEKNLKGLREDLILADKILRSLPPPVLK